MGGEKQLNQSGSCIIHIHPGNCLISPAALDGRTPQTMALVEVGGSSPAEVVGKVVITPKTNAPDQRGEFSSEDNGRWLIRSGLPGLKGTGEFEPERAHAVKGIVAGLLKFSN